MTVEESLPKELADVLNSPDFDDDAGILIEAVQYNGDDLCLTFSIRSYENIPQQIWQVNVTDIKEEKLTSSWTQNIGLYNQHFLLLEHKDIYAELYFKGSTIEWQELFVGIVQALLQYSDIEDVCKYFFTPEAIKKVCQQNYGLFARGPKTILKLYQEQLINHGIHAYFIGDVERFKDEKALKLFKLGDSYIIGRTFLFERIK